MNESKEDTTMPHPTPFSREQLMLIEFCVMNSLVRGHLDVDAAVDAVALLQEVRRLLGTDPNAIIERLSEKLRAALDE